MTLMNNSNFVCIKVLLKIIIVVGRLDIGGRKNGRSFSCVEDQVK